MKRIMVAFITIVSILLINFGCSKDRQNVQPTLYDLYQYSVTDAIVADSSEICDTLWQINSSNTKLVWKTINNKKYVLAGNFNKHPESYLGSSELQIFFK